MKSGSGARIYDWVTTGVSKLSSNKQARYRVWEQRLVLNSCSIQYLNDFSFGTSEIDFKNISSRNSGTVFENFNLHVFMFSSYLRAEILLAV